MLTTGPESKRERSPRAPMGWAVWSSDRSDLRSGPSPLQTDAICRRENKNKGLFCLLLLYYQSKFSLNFKAENSFSSLKIVHLSHGCFPRLFIFFILAEFMKEHSKSKKSVKWKV